MGSQRVGHDLVTEQQIVSAHIFILIFKRCLLLERKAMTNLDSILKSRDIILPSNVHLVKDTVFPVVMYGCESWAIKKARTRDLMLLNCGAGEDS